MKTLLEVAALILGLVNGVFLLKYYLRDKPKLSVSPVHPDTYQWFFELPAGEIEGHETRRYGYLAYISILNSGIRDVELKSWRLHAKTVRKGFREPKAVSIPEPKVILGDQSHAKIYPVLGQQGLSHDGSTMVKAGGSISGFAYYILEVFGPSDWNPLIDDSGYAIGKIEVEGILGNTAKSDFRFRYITLKEAKSFISNIDSIDRQDETLPEGEKIIKTD